MASHDHSHDDHERERDHADGAHAHHDHAHGHSHAPKDFGPAFAIGVLLNSAFVAGEVVYGLRVDSLALLADAGHNLSDVLGLLLAWVASVLVKRASSPRFTYGLRGTSILAALVNATLLTLVTGAIAWEAVLRLAHPSAVEGGTVMAVAAVGVVVNLATALLFMSGRQSDLNVRAAFAHMAGDPVVSLGVSLIVVMTTWGLLTDSLALSLQGVPREVDAQAVGRWLSALPGVASVHELHIWAMSTTENALTAHLVYPDGFPGDACLRGICEELRAHHAIDHVTIQVETGEPGRGCPGAAARAGADEGATGLAFKPACGAPPVAGATPRSRPAPP
jgi:cobalt-zinc-cadmium efflux system protein